MSGTSRSGSVDKKLARQQAAARRAELAPLTKEVKRLETEMERCAKRLAAIEAALLDASIYDDDNKAKLTELLTEQGQLREQNDNTEERWLALQEELEALSTAD